MHALWILLSTGTALAVEPVPDAEEPAPDAQRPPADAEHPSPENTAVRPEPEVPGDRARRPESAEGLMPDALEGTWWLVDDDRDRQIDALAAEMPFYLRAMARTRLRAVTFPCDAMHLEEVDDLLSVTCDDRLPAAAPPGQTVEYAEGVRLTMTVSGDSLVQTFTRKDGVRRNVFTPTPGGGMKLEVTVRSPHLPRELVYERTFSRDGEPVGAPGVTETEAPAGGPAGT